MGVAAHRIVVAEDDEAFLAALENVLGGDGRFDVVGLARDGREAVELTRALRPDAIVMDIEMPGVDGVEATRQIAHEVPVVAISGHDYEERVLEIRHAGAADYVRKARVADDLCDVLAALLE